MKKTLILAFAMFPVAVIGADDNAQKMTAAGAKDTTKFCYADGKEFSKGYRLVDQTKRVLVCSEERSWVSGPNRPPAMLEWAIDTDNKIRGN